MKSSVVQVPLMEIFVTLELIKYRVATIEVITIIKTTAAITIRLANPFELKLFLEVLAVDTI
jgi:hypothetical protein